MDGQWVVTFQCRRCSEHTTIRRQMAFAKRMDLPTLSCEKCGSHNNYASLRMVPGRFVESFASHCPSCSKWTNIIGKLPIVADKESGVSQVVMPDEIVCVHCHARSLT